MISSVPQHMDELVSTGSKDRMGENKLKPKSVIDYNKAKKGVDISDQMSSYYTCLRKSIKWYKKAMFEVILGTYVVNSWVIYNRNKQKKIDMLKFREEIIDKLLDCEDNETEAEDHQDVDDQRKGKKKINYKLKRVEENFTKNHKRCTVCYDKIQREQWTKEARLKTKRIITYCDSGPDAPPMCLDCFNQKHA
ncbi:uncharacterized protein [Diabrotica undecimpunctata]|uniref:uncharacterized protein n=1 Tax=Diabrotica undecimpunctata TaxID=50387 RepID=UPI003B63A5F5